MALDNLRNARGFFSDYYLGSIFARSSRSARLTDRETDSAWFRFRKLFMQASGRCETPADTREKFLRPLLRDAFGFHLGAENANAANVRGLYASADDEVSGKPPLVLVWTGGWDDDLDSPSVKRPGRRTLTPHEHLAAALTAANLRHGLLATGERLRLIRAEGDGPRGAYLELDLDGAQDDEDAASFAAALRLLHLRAFTPDASGAIPIEAVEKENLEHAERISKDLKRAVFDAAERLSDALLRHEVGGVRHEAEGMRHEAEGMRHEAGGVRHEAGRMEKERVNERDSEPQGFDGLAKIDETGEGHLRTVSSPSRRGAVGIDVPGPQSGDIRSCQYRGRVWPPGDGRVSASFAHQQRISVGTGDGTADLCRTGPSQSGSLVGADEGDQRAKQDARDADLSSSLTSQASDLAPHASSLTPHASCLTPLGSIRDAALWCLYRLLFILYAEARFPKLDQNPIYRDSYSLHGLLEELLRIDPESLPRNRFGYWARIRALFRIYHDGLPPIERLPALPGRGGDLFAPGTPQAALLDAAALPDAEIAAVILDLATAPPRRGVGRERISFRELNVEELGAVYEGLLEHEPRISTETVFEVAIKGKPYALPESELASLLESRDGALAGEVDLVAGTGLARFAGSAAPVEDQDAEEGEVDEEEEESAKKGKGRLAVKLERRIEPGRFHFIPGAARKGTGSFYTPRPLVAYLVRKALGPAVEVARAIPEKAVEKIEALRVIDPACGSGHFLVEAMRFLGRELHRAYVERNGGKPPEEFEGEWDSDWKATDDEARAALSEARAWCKRRIAERCLFGIDINPTAVELARVALWIESLAGDRRLSFFKHHIRCGNSLVGTWIERLAEPPLSSLRMKSDPPPGGVLLWESAIRERIESAIAARRLIDEAERISELRSETSAGDRFKEEQYRKAEDAVASARLLCDLRNAAAWIPPIWNDWPNLLMSDPEKLEGFARSRTWWNDFERVRRDERFFHWELEFPEIFRDDAREPGFDAVLGNPPWEKAKPDRKEFYARYDVLIRDFKGGDLDRRIREIQRRHPEAERDEKLYESRVKALAASLNQSGDYTRHVAEIDGKQTGGDPDLFKFFVERAWQVLRKSGRAGLVVPSGVYSNEGCTGLRRMLFEESRVEAFYVFENKKKIFPIHSSYKFIALAFEKAAGHHRKSPAALDLPLDEFEAAFARHDLAELETDGPKPWMVTIKRSEIESLSPGTLAFLEWRSPRDREILLRMYDGKPLLGDSGPGTWNVEFYTEFNITNDRDLWTDPSTGRLWTVRQILGREPADFAETRVAMDEKGFWPLYQDAHIHQFVLEFKPIMRWVSLEAHERKYGGRPDPTMKLVIRDPARNTDERTCIAALLPPNSCFGNTLTGVRVANETQLRLLPILNSLSFDYLVRRRVVGQHLQGPQLRPCALPPPDSDAAVCSQHPGLIHANQKQTWIYDHEEYFETLWKNERLIAEGYGLGPDDFARILEDFPIFQKKRPRYLEFIRQGLTRWRKE